MIKLLLIVALVAIAFTCVMYAFVKFRGKKNYDNKMATYKLLKPQQRITVIHERKNKQGAVIHGSSRSGYMVNVGNEIININFSMFVKAN